MIGTHATGCECEDCRPIRPAVGRWLVDGKPLTPRFLLDSGFLEHLATVDSSYGECNRDGRLAVYIDYRRGVPLSVQLVRMPGAVSFKLHHGGSDSA